MKAIFNFVAILSFVIPATFTSCSKDENYPTDQKRKEIESNVKTGTWEITYFNDSGTIKTAHFTGYNFTFAANGVLTATNGTTTYTGTWSITDSNSNDDSLNDLHFNINFNLINDFSDLNDDWDITFQSVTKIQLIDISGGSGGTDYLTFEKK
jgi:hypothetical protein